MKTELELLIEKYQKQWDGTEMDSGCDSGWGSGISYSSLLSDLYKLKELVAISDQEKYYKGFHDGCNKTAIELSKSDTVDQTERLECLCVSWCTGSNQLNKVFKCGNKFVSNGNN
tara:strand:- start:1 stop:345 length:345 start_codon:yes stop_codon:yes gene_type:complete